MNIYIGNLSNEVTEHELLEAFRAFGQVKSVNIIKDRYSDLSRGFGFVDMPVSPSCAPMSVKFENAFRPSERLREK